MLLDGRPAGGRVGGPPADPGRGCRTRRWWSTASRSAPTGRSTEVAPGEVDLEVVFTPPPGQKLDERYGPATRLVVSATPPALLREGEGRGDGADPAGWCSTRTSATASCTWPRWRRPATTRPGDRVPRLPRAPAGLGRAGATGRGRPGASSRSTSPAEHGAHRVRPRTPTSSGTPTGWCCGATATAAPRRGRRPRCARWPPRLPGAGRPRRHRPRHRDGAGRRADPGRVAASPACRPTRAARCSPTCTTGCTRSPGREPHRARPCCTSTCTRSTSSCAGRIRSSSTGPTPGPARPPWTWP